MALLTTYGDFNKVTDEALQQSLYLLNVPDWTPGWSWLVYKRISTKRYSYVGMEYATAVSCATAKKEQYQFTTYTWTGGTTLVETTVDGAQVVAQRQDSCIYNVDVQVNVEEVVRFTWNSPVPGTDHDMPTRAEIMAQFPTRDFDETTTTEGGE